MKIRANVIGAAALLTSFGITAGASAQSVTEVRAASVNDLIAVAVSVDDLDLASPGGQEILYYRLSAAAEKVCGSADLRVAGSLTRAARNADCQEASLSRALARINRGAVATLH